MHTARVPSKMPVLTVRTAELGFKVLTAYHSANLSAYQVHLPGDTAEAVEGNLEGIR